MRCSDCHGVIEGNRPFCPHCGRKLGGLLKARPTAGISKPGPRLARPRFRLGKAEAEATSPQAQWLGRMVVFPLLGAIIAAALPGHRWGLGLIIGLFIALQTRKKS